MDFEFGNENNDENEENDSENDRPFSSAVPEFKQHKITWSEQDAELARMNFVSARKKMMIRSPFYSACIHALPMRLATGREVAMYRIKRSTTDGNYMIVHPTGWNELTNEQRVAELAKNILTCILRHIARGYGRDPYLWSLSSRAITTALLVQGKFEVNKDNPYLDGYEKESIEAVFHDFSKEHGKKASGIWDSAINTQGEITFLEEWQEAVKGLDHVIENEIGYVPCDLLICQNPNGKGGGGDGKDKESKWYSLGFNAMRAGIMHGDKHMPALDVINIANKAPEHWYKQLSSALMQNGRSGYDYSRPSRRFVWQDRYMPKFGGKVPGRKVLAMDTSGSMSEDLIADCLGHCNTIMLTTNCEIDLLCVDTQVDYKGRFSASNPLPKKLELTGRGGTSFVPIDEWVRAKEPKNVIWSPPSSILVFTDSAGEFPENPYEPNSWHWIMTERRSESDVYYPKFGKVIFMD